MRWFLSFYFCLQRRRWHFWEREDEREMELTHLIGNALAINICLVIVSLLSRKMANKLEGGREGGREERKKDRQRGRCRREQTPACCSLQLPACCENPTASEVPSYINTYLPTYLVLCSVVVLPVLSCTPLEPRWFPFSLLVPPSFLLPLSFRFFSFLTCYSRSFPFFFFLAFAPTVSLVRV